jgi:hypothetical protein
MRWRWSRWAVKSQTLPAVWLVAMLAAAAVAHFGWRHWRAGAELRQPLPPMAQPGPQHGVHDCSHLASAPGRLMVVLVLGQSNAANHVQNRAAGGANVYTWHQGRCLDATDPLPGATGDGGSLWTRLGPRIVAAGIAEAVLFAPVAVNATSVSQWARHPELIGGLQTTVQGLHAAGLQASHVIWYQGEADSFKQTSAAAYRRDFLLVLQRLRKLGVHAPVWMAQATLCQQRSNPQVRALQAALPREGPGVRAGPDMDALFGPSHRFDGCHFGTESALLAAEAWRQALQSAAPPSRERPP